MSGPNRLKRYDFDTSCSTCIDDVLDVRVAEIPRVRTRVAGPRGGNKTKIGIGMSVVVLGLVVAFQFSLPTVGAMVLVGFFAIFHGHAHGEEMPSDVSGLSYGVGFVCATAVLHAIGIGLGRAIDRRVVSTFVGLSKSPGV